MFRNYLITAYRNLLRCKLDSFLNISGLVIGLSAALLIILFIQHEQSYDSFWKDSDRLYRIQTRWVMENRDDIDIVGSAGPLKAALESYYPNELEAVSRLLFRRPVINTSAETFIDSITYADQGILDIFNFKIISGDAQAALADNSSIILNETLARKYFGTMDPIGKTLTLDYSFIKRDYQVKAVMQDLPVNSHTNIQAMIKIDESDFIDNNGSWMFSTWNAASNHTYFKLKPGINIELINRQISEFTDKSVPDKDNKASEYTKFTTIPVPDIHLHSVGAGGRKPGGDSTIVLAFGIIALLIVIVATINYVNLSTARAGQRAREVAMRKVMGAKRSQLIIQHISESMLIVSFAIIITLIVVELALPFFNQMLNLELVLNLTEPMTLIGLLTTLLVVGGLSGLYPALILSSYRPSQTLGSNRSNSTVGAVKARNILVIFQTAITVSLIVATTVVYAQLTYFSWLDRGFEPAQMLVIGGMSRSDVREKRLTFKERIATLPGVTNVSLSFEAPTQYSENNTRLRKPGESQEQSYPLGSTSVDYDYLDTLKIPLLAGRFYQQDRALDQKPATDDVKNDDVLEGNLVINELAAEKLGFSNPQQALGQIVTERYYFDDDKGIATIRLTIIGVIGNSNIHSAKKPVRPEVLYLVDNYGFLMIRYSGEPQGVVSNVREVWSEMMADSPFDYFHVEEALAEELQNEGTQANIFLGFTLLTTIIGCLGLYGLAAFVIESRKKEIGVRKILGARVRDVLALLLGQFSRLVIIANLIAWPVTYLLMSDWLQQYPFRLDNSWVFLFCMLSGLVSAVVVATTVGSQVWNVARDNPINAIRQE